MKAKKIIRKLGFEYDVLKSLFLPHINQMTYDINLIVKNLYLMCEKMTIAEGGKLILYLQNNDSSLTFFDHSYLEVFLLHWITDSTIAIDPPNLSALLNYFKQKENDVLKELLSDAIKTSTKIKLPPPSLKDQTFERNTAVDDIHNMQTEKLTGEGDRQPNSVGPLDDRAYIVRKECAGFLLIINQKQFHRDTRPHLKEHLPEVELKDRNGTDKDKDRLKEVFEEFGYKAEVRENVKHDEFMDEVERVVERSLVYDSLIVCILSHGIQDYVYGSNSIPFKIDKIKDRMKCPALIGKPKILLIQACQGNEKQLPVCIFLSILCECKCSITLMFVPQSVLATVESQQFPNCKHHQKNNHHICFYIFT